jgi:uncharacterized protein
MPASSHTHALPLPVEIEDAHVHFFSYHFLELLRAQKAELSETPVRALAARLGWEDPAEDPVDLAARWVAELDARGVRRAALIASLPGDEGSVAAAVAAFPDRFYGTFFVNPLAPGALERARAAVEDKGLRVMGLLPAMHGYSVHDERVRPFFALAAAVRGTAMFVHCGVLTVGVRKKLGLASPFDMRFSNPIDLHGLALRYPEVPMIVPHFGAGYFREALMLADLCPNVYLDTSSSNSWVKYQPCRMGLQEVFERALEVAGPQRLLFGSDSSFFPRGWHAAIFTEQWEVLEALGMNMEERALICGGNLRRLLRGHR